MRRMLRSSSTTRMLANRFLPHRNIDGKSGAVSEFAAREDSPVMRLDDFFCDVKPEPCRAYVRGVIGELCERFEDEWENIGRDAGSGIGHDCARDISLALNFEFDSSALRRIA